jgi:hypothetical protein
MNIMYGGAGSQNVSQNAWQGSKGLYPLHTKIYGNIFDDPGQWSLESIRARCHFYFYYRNLPLEETRTLEFNFSDIVVHYVTAWYATFSFWPRHKMSKMPLGQKGFFFLVGNKASTLTWVNSTWTLGLTPMG